MRDVDSTEMAPGLFQGGLGDWAGCPVEFYDLHEVVVLCPTDRNGPGGTRVSVGNRYLTEINLTDSRRDLNRKDELKKLAVKLVDDINNGYNVGIFCWQGRNRSGLLTALVLRNLYDWTGSEAMAHIKSARAGALETETGCFEEYLEKLGRPRRK